MARDSKLYYPQWITPLKFEYLYIDTRIIHSIYTNFIYTYYGIIHIYIYMYSVVYIYLTDTDYLFILTHYLL